MQIDCKGPRWSWLPNLFRIDGPEEGQTLVEYALILAFVAMLLVGALTLLQGGLVGAYADIADAIP